MADRLIIEKSFSMFLIYCHMSRLSCIHQLPNPFVLGPFLVSTLRTVVWLISHQPVVLFSHNKPVTTNQTAVLFSQNKSAPAPNEQAVGFS
jgi:hypothetical protein